ncbi:hypothetical protein K3759_19125 (plasmid) [Sulfitobacter sp. W027]|uniref:hypothetical protein n=1 Tax=Sulfitobacter sp. W027 TaxID=2867025 RepID=UPI0021A8A111|nr:hypothetical protein [Sulfitobacter sp. W027]UWR35798.1 hypothetical protein K3759_19125 [Sulfitobacter sp. W027]
MQAFKIIMLSLWLHPFRWFFGGLSGAFAWDVVGRGLVEQSDSLMLIFDQWWAAVKHFFDHPLGEIILLGITIYLIWSAVRATITKERGKELEIETSSRKIQSEFRAEIKGIVQDYKTEMKDLLDNRMPEHMLKRADDAATDAALFRMDLESRNREFAEAVEQLQACKQANEGFLNTLNRLDELERKVRRIEENDKP